jgi:hypothetical protein
MLELQKFPRCVSADTKGLVPCMLDAATSGVLKSRVQRKFL